MPSTNLRLAIFVRGRYRNMLYGQRLNLDLKDFKALGVHPANGATLSDKSVRIIKEYLLQRDYTCISTTLSISPHEKLDLKSFEFEYRVLGTKITGKSELRVSTGTRVQS